MKPTELLAPAGDFACLRAAFNAGADAVYLAGKSFGARAFANNFEEDELIEALKYAHLLKKKIYLTLNTLIKESEFDLLISYLTPYYEHGLDGIIIQDLGLIPLLKKEFPMLELHASTQMTVNNYRSAAWLKEQEDALGVVEEELVQLTDNIHKIKSNSKDVLTTISAFLETYHVYCETEKYQAKLYELKLQLAEFERLEEKRARYEALKKQYEAGVLIIRDFEETYQFKLGEERAEGLSFLQTKATEYRIAKDAYGESLRKRETFENAREKSFWTREARCPYSLEELNQMITEADAKLEDLKLAQNQYAKQLEDLQEQMDLCDEKAEELEEQLELQQADTEKYNLVKLTQDFLQKAKEQFIAKYMEPISRGFSKYYTMLTGDTRGEWMIDANINLKVREYGELRETHWLSAGYQDLIGVCMRLALVDAMYQGEKPFLILDDPFVNLDKEKVEYGNKLLLSVAEEYQVIYFTCHDSRSPM